MDTSPKFKLSDIPQPDPTKMPGVDYGLIAVRTTIDDTLPAFPAGNFFALSLLLKIIADAVNASGQRVIAAASAGTLNDGLVIISIESTASRIAALGAVHAAIEECLMKPVTVIGYFCCEELIWRAVYPNSAALLDVDAKRYVAAAEQLRQAQETWNTRNECPSGEYPAL